MVYGCIYCGRTDSPEKNEEEKEYWLITTENFGKFYRNAINCSPFEYINKNRLDTLINQFQITKEQYLKYLKG